MEQPLQRPNEPEVPNTSRSEPSSHVDAAGIPHSQPPAIWWIGGALAVLIAGGITAALVF